MSIPKDKEGNGRGFGFITYRHQASVPYALSIFSGTRLFNRELRLDNRSGTGNRNGNINRRNQSFDQHMKPGMTSTVPQHQYHIQSPFGNPAAIPGSNALTNPFNSTSTNPFNNMIPKQNNTNQMNFESNQQIDYQQLLAYSAQLLSSVNSVGSNNIGGNDETHKSQSKMMRRHDNRPHNQNSISRQYSRDDRVRSRRDRSRSPRSEWIRNRDRRDRNHRR